MGSVEESGIVYNFKAAMLQDLDVFMNMDEFCSIHDIDGEQIPCVSSSDNIARFNHGRQVRESDYDGVNARSLTLWVRDEYVARAESGMTVHVDGRVYIVVEAVKMVNSVWRLSLEASDS